MSYTNTAQRYGSIARWMHWSTAILFLFAYVTVYFRQWFTEPQTDINMSALHLHLSAGITLGVLVVLRIMWRLYSPPPAAVESSPLVKLAAHIGHLALYGIMIAMPVTGYLGTGVSTNFFGLFEIPKFADTWLFSVLIEQGLGMDFATFEKPIDFIHKDILGAWLVWILVVGHASAALYHHLIIKDDTLRRMVD